MTMRRRGAGGKGSRAALRANSRPTPIAPVHPSASQPEPDDVSSLANSIAALTVDVPLSKPPKPPKEIIKTFPLFRLPSELRLKVYECHFANTGEVVDLDADNRKRIHQKLGILRVCRLVYNEANHLWWSTHVVRLFPIYGRFFKAKKPLLARLTPRQRGCVNTVQLRLGPGWTHPPRGWAVNDALGLEDCTAVRRLKVFVEFDPSNDDFKEFRRSDGFYEGFSRQLLDAVLERMPWCRIVEFDANPSVKKSGGMMRSLLEVVASKGRKLAWGPEKGWDDGDEVEEAAKKPDHSPIARIAGVRTTLEGVYISTPHGQHGQGQSMLVLAQ